MKPLSKFHFYKKLIIFFEFFDRNFRSVGLGMCSKCEQILINLHKKDLIYLT